MTNFRGLVIPADGELDCYETTITDITQIQDVVGGFFDCLAVKIPNTRFGDIEADVWLNDEGRVTNLPVNGRASSFFRHKLFGSVLITGGADDEGETVDVHPEISVACRLADAAIKLKAMPDVDPD